MVRSGHSRAARARLSFEACRWTPCEACASARKGRTMIRKLHHNAYRCRDSEETRAFYEDFLGLPLVQAFEIGQTKTGRATHTLHTFYRLDDGSHMAFFETSDMPFEFKPQHDFDLHIALEVDPEALTVMLAKGKELGI
jgi:catechol 2,3-dioxygenase-like lactoylglutathione lyase family enzyme